MSLYVLPWRAEFTHAGLMRNAVLSLVRPDGYVAFADSDGRASGLSSCLNTRQLSAPLTAPARAKSLGEVSLSLVLRPWSFGQSFVHQVLVRRSGQRTEDLGRTLDPGRTKDFGPRTTDDVLHRFEKRCS